MTAGDSVDLRLPGSAVRTTTACWMNAGQIFVLCLSDPMSPKVARLWMEGACRAAVPTAPAQYSGTPSPIRLDLDNGAG